MIIAAGLLGCSNSDGGSVKNDKDSPNFSANILDFKKLSRATGTTWDAEDEIGIYALQTKWSNLYRANARYKIEDVAKGTMVPFTEADKILFPQQGQLTFEAYYPYSDAVEGGLYPIDVTNQIDLAKIDLLYAKAQGLYDKNNPNVTFSFEHKLTNVLYNLVWESGEGTVEAPTLKLVGVDTKANYNLESGAIENREMGGEIAFNEFVDNKSEIIIIPGQYSDAKVMVSFMGRLYELTENVASMEYKAGERHIYNLKVSAGAEPVGVEIVGSTIEQWGSGEGEDHNVGN